MPIFEFTCKACGTTFEELLNRSSKQTVKCPKCGSGNVYKILSSTVISSGEQTSSSTSSCKAPGGFS